MRSIFTILCLTFISVTGWSQNFDYSFVESYSPGLPVHMMISSSDGNIDLAAWDKPGVLVYFIARRMGHVLKIDKKELQQDIILEIEQTGNDLKISARNKTSESFFNWSNSIEVSFRIFAPAQMISELNSSDGNISIHGGFTGQQHMKTSDGNIAVTKVTGDVSGATSDGNVDIDGVQGKVDVRTSDGNIKLSYVQGDAQSSTSDGNIELLNINGDVYARTSDGQISFDNLSGSLNASTSDGNIRGSMVKVGRELTLKTSDGSIDVKVPANSGWDMSIRGESLHVPLQNFSGQADKKSIQGKMNGGGPGLNLVTGDGDISVTYN